MACFGKLELLVALLLYLATMTHDSVSCYAQQCRVGCLVSGVLFGISSTSSLVHINFFCLN